MHVTFLQYLNTIFNYTHILTLTLTLTHTHTHTHSHSHTHTHTHIYIYINKPEFVTFCVGKHHRTAVMEYCWRHRQYIRRENRQNTGELSF